MSEVLGKLNRTIQAQGPDQLWVQTRDALAAAYQTIIDLHAVHANIIENLTYLANDSDTPDDIEDALREIIATPFVTPEPKEEEHADGR